MTTPAAGQPWWGKALQWGGAAGIVGALSIGGYIALTGGGDTPPTTTTLATTTTAAPTTTTTTIDPATVACTTYLGPLELLIADIDAASAEVLDVLTEVVEEDLDYDAAAGMIFILANRMEDLGVDAAVLGDPPSDLATAYDDMRVAIRLYVSSWRDIDEALGDNDGDAFERAFTIFEEADDLMLGVRVSIRSAC